jgi:hypothetical protein
MLLVPEYICICVEDILFLEDKEEFATRKLASVGVL